MNNNPNISREIEVKIRLDELRTSLSEYCIDVCKSRCCKYGKLLLLNSKEVEFIAEGSETKLFKDEVLVKSKDNNVYYNFEKAGGQCTKLSGIGLCSVYKDKNRPKICSDYPLFKVGEFIISANNCDAVKNGVLDVELDKLSKEFGLKII